MLRSVKSVVRPVYHAIGGPRMMRYLQTGRWKFERERRRYFATHVTNRGVPADDPNLVTLVDDGFVVLHEFHDKALIRTIHDKALGAIERVHKGDAPPQWKTVVYREDGIYRLHSIEKYVSEAKAILDHPYTNQLLRGYLGEQFRTGHNYLDYKPELVHDHTTVPHFDSFKSQIKIFTLLSDVTPANAPFVYWKRSHRDGEWRRPIDYLQWAGDYIGSGGVVPPHVLRDRTQLSTPDAFEEVEVTGKAGTVIVADTRGAHRASNLREGYRLQIVQKFTIH